MSKPQQLLKSFLEESANSGLSLLMLLILPFFFFLNPQKSEFKLGTPPSVNAIMMLFIQKKT